MNKRYITTFILFASFFCSNVQANVATAAGVIAVEKTAKTAIDHPFMAAGALSGFALYKILSVDNAVVQIAKEPEALDYYLEHNPNKITKFTEITIRNMEKSDPDGRYQNLLNKLYVSTPPLVNTANRKKDEQKDLESSKIFLEQYKLIEQHADDFDKKNKKICSKKDTERFIKEAPFEFKMTNMKNNVPYKNDNTAIAYNFDQYSLLERYGSNLEADHIPSYKALELYFLAKNPLSFTIKRNVRHRFLVSNASAINLDLSLHEKTRTYKGANSTWAKIDALNLRIATFKDIATLLTIAKINSNKYNYILLKESLFSLYDRNKILCLYDN